MNKGARYLLLSVSLFQLVNLAVKALPRLPVEQIVFWRALISLSITFVALKYYRIGVVGTNHRLLILRGLAGTVALSLFFYTLKVMPLATAVTIQYLAPLFTVMISAVAFGERVSATHWVCALIGFAGVWMIQGYDPRVDAFDAGIGVISAIASAIAYNTVRSLRRSDHELVVVFYFPLVASIISFPFAYNTWVWPQGQEWLMIAIAGVFTQFAQVYLTKAYQAEQASKIAPIGYAGVLWAVLYGVLLFDETLPLTTVSGMGLIVASVIISSRAKT